MPFERYKVVRDEEVLEFCINHGPIVNKTVSCTLKSVKRVDLT